MVHTALEVAQNNLVFALIFLLVSLGIYLFIFRMLRGLHPHIGGDELAHLSFINNYRKKINPYALDHQPQAHHLFNLIMSRIPEEHTLHAGRRLNFLFVLTFYLPIIFYLSLSFQWSIALFAIAFSMLSPWGLGLNVARLATLTERAWSDCFFVFGLFLFLILDNNSFTSIFLPAISWALIWPSSSFNRQSIILISLAYWLLSGDASLSFIAICSYLIALVFFGVVINRQIIAQVRHMNWYFKNRKFLLYRNHSFEAWRPSSILRKANKIVTGIISEKLLYFSPFFLFYVVFFLLHFEEGSKLFLVTASVLSVALCTAIGYLRIVGPSARYWSFVQPLVYSILLSSSFGFAFFLVVETIFSIYLTNLRIAKLRAEKKKDPRSDISKLVAELNRILMKNEIVIFSNMKLASSINCSSVAPMFKTIGIGFEKNNSTFFSRYVQQYPFLSIELLPFLDEFKVSGLVFEKQDKTVDYEVNWRVFENIICVDNFVIYYGCKGEPITKESDFSSPFCGSMRW